jgi:hypothetical protein
MCDDEATKATIRFVPRELRIPIRSNAELKKVMAFVKRCGFSDEAVEVNYEHN